MNTEELLNQKNIVFRYSGGDLLIHCLSPEHIDNNPSLRIDKITGKFNCFSCGFSGNIFKHFNIEQNLLDIRVQGIKDKIHKLNKVVLNKPLSALPFRENYRNIKPETFKRFDAFTDQNDEDFKGRVVFPLFDIYGETVLFHSRYIHSELKPKYFNKPSHTELPLFPSIPDEIINGSIILVEGFFDMLNLWDKGLKNVVCIFGSNIVSKRDRGYAKIISRFAQYRLQGVNKLVLLLDGDDAGIRGMDKLEKALSSNYIIQKVNLADGLDPGDMTQKDITALRKYLYDT